MKHLVTLGAVALTLPAIAMAQAPEGDRPDRGEQRTQQPAGQHQDRQQQAGQRMGQERISRLEHGHIKLSDLTDTSIVNRNDEEVGTVSDVILDEQGRVAAVIVSTGGLMGLGDTERALSWDDVQVRAKADEDDEYEVIVNLSEQELEDLPEFEAERRTAESAR